MFGNVRQCLTRVTKAHKLENRKSGSLWINSRIIIGCLGVMWLTRMVENGTIRVSFTGASFQGLQHETTHAGCSEAAVWGINVGPIQLGAGSALYGRA